MDSDDDLGDLGPMEAELAALRVALGGAYQTVREGQVDRGGVGADAEGGGWEWEGDVEGNDLPEGDGVGRPSSAPRHPPRTGRAPARPHRPAPGARARGGPPGSGVAAGPSPLALEMDAPGRPSAAPLPSPRSPPSPTARPLPAVLERALATNRSLQARLRGASASLAAAQGRNAAAAARLERYLATCREVTKGSGSGGGGGGSGEAGAGSGAGAIPAKLRRPVPRTRQWFWTGVIRDLATVPTDARGGAPGTADPYGGEARGSGTDPPASPPRVSFLRAVGDALPPWLPDGGWRQEACEALRLGVVAVAQETETKRMLGELEGGGDRAAVGQGGGDGWGAGDVSPRVARLALYRRRRDEIASLPDDSRALESAAGHFTRSDWVAVLNAARLRGAYGPREAQSAWQNALRPGLKRGPWGADEDARLRDAVVRLGDRRWAQVSAELGGSRSVVDCLGRWEELAADRDGGAPASEPSGEGLRGPAMPPRDPEPVSVEAASHVAVGVVALPVSPEADVDPTTLPADPGGDPGGNPGTVPGDGARPAPLPPPPRRPSTEIDLGRLGGLVSSLGRQWRLVAEAYGGGWTKAQIMHVWRRHEMRDASGDPHAPAAPAAPRASADGPAAAPSPAPDAPPDAPAARPKKGRWTRDEDDSLYRAMAVHGSRWARVALLVPGRSDVQCRERWANVLDPSVRTSEAWGEAEVQRLVELVRAQLAMRQRVKWAEVARQLPGRTDKVVALQWKRLRRDSAAGTAVPFPLPAARVGTPHAAVVTEGGGAGASGRAAEEASDEPSVGERRADAAPARPARGTSPASRPRERGRRRPAHPGLDPATPPRVRKSTRLLRALPD